MRLFLLAAGALTLLLILVATPLYEKFVLRYDSPWWTGTQNLRVCDAFDASKCYLLPVNSDGNQVRSVNFPSGGYSTASRSTCAKAGQTDYNVDRFCSILDQDGREWDILPN